MMSCDPTTKSRLKQVALYLELTGGAIAVGVTTWITSTGWDGNPTKILLGIAISLGAVGGVLDKFCQTGIPPTTP